MKRVLPRDAFNDANLLKCIGALTMLIEDKCATVRGLSFDYDGSPFDIQQDASDGSTYVANVQFCLGRFPVAMRRPLNSRDNYPLIMTHKEEEYYVFSESGAVLPAFDKLV